MARVGGKEGEPRVAFVQTAPKSTGKAGARCLAQNFSRPRTCPFIRTVPVSLSSHGVRETGDPISWRDFFLSLGVRVYSDSARLLDSALFLGGGKECASGYPL